MCPHFHIPLQSSSNAVLQRMKRRYTAEFFANTVERIRACVQAASITTDVLVGFPGKSEEEFQETYRFCQDIRFSDIHVFPYSVRPGTSAAHFQDRVDPVTRGQRGALLTQLAEQDARDFRKGMLGQVRPVLWERERTGHYASHSDGRWSGLTDNYVRTFTDDPRPLGNTVAETRLLQEHDGALYGRVVC
ncbi:MAG: radical SAM protein [Chloroflexi bacterium]|nr:radical SAM protein [Chloroflexota bacterium]